MTRGVKMKPPSDVTSLHQLEGKGFLRRNPKRTVPAPLLEAPLAHSVCKAPDQTGPRVKSSPSAGPRGRASHYRRVNSSV